MILNTQQLAKPETYSINKDDILMPWTLIRADTVVSHILSVYIIRPRLLTSIVVFDMNRIFW